MAVWVLQLIKFNTYYLDIGTSTWFIFAILDHNLRFLLGRGNITWRIMEPQQKWRSLKSGGFLRLIVGQEMGLEYKHIHWIH
jgi:hypothetical protein